MKTGLFKDFYRGDGVYVAGSRWLIAFRWRWRFAFVCPPAKPGYSRLYLGPFEFEYRKPATRKIKEEANASES